MPRIYISIGSNISREENICAAIEALRATFANLTLSSVYESKSVGFEGDDFYNLVVAADTPESVSEVREKLREIEMQQGRTRDERRFSSRTIDLDLLLFDEQVIKQDGFELPRPEITRYAFVLGPLAEVAPAARHPVTGETYQSLWDSFDKRSQAIYKVDFQA